MTTTTLILGARLPRTAAALKRLRGRRRTQSWWPAWLLGRRAPALCCDRCAREMLDSLRLGDELICIRCVAETRLPMAGPELAGATAVLRTLFLEAELEWREQCTRPFPDRRRLDAIVETAELVLWWLTPPNLRKPDTAAVGEHTALAVMASFDRTWALRGPGRTLASVFTAWRHSQVKALRYAELADVDRRYEALIEAGASEQ